MYIPIMKYNNNNNNNNYNNKYNKTIILFPQ